MPMISSTRRGSLDFRLMVMCLLLTAFGLALVVQLPGRSVALAERQQNDVDFREFADLFSEIYNRIGESYVEEVDNKRLFEGAINGMMAVLDPYSSWLPPAEQEMLTKDTEGEYSGVGLHITLDEQRILTVLLPIIGSPAAKAGVQPWDRIVEIDGETTQDMTLNQAVEKLTGPEGSQVTIKVWRPDTGEMLDFTLTRGHIKVESVFSKIFDDDIGYLRIAKFQDDTAVSVRDALLEFNRKGVRGVIVDVRYNAGGLLERVQEICDMFLERGQTIVSIKGRTDGNNRTYISRNDPICTQPLIVLVNQFSASASEILAGAIQDNKRGVIVGPEGTSTYGKASVQTISMLRNSLHRDENGGYKQSGLRLTTAYYYTPSGNLIMDKGITPDIGVKITPEQEQALRQHGLLGEPTRIEPGSRPGSESDPAKVVPAPGTEEGPEGETDEDGENTNSSSAPAETPARPATGTAAAGEAADEEFHDVVLDEAIKYLRAILIMEGTSRRAA